MSIQSEINRITTAVSDQESLIGEIVTALAERCVVTEPLLQARTVTPTEEVQVITPDAGYDGLSSVTVEAAQGGEGTYGWKKCVSSLPSGYTAVEYIQSTGTQYINTGFTPNQDTSVYMDTEVLSVNNASGGAFFFGCASPYKADGFESFVWNTAIHAVYNSSDIEGTETISVGDRLSIQYAKNNCAVLRYGIEVYNNTFTSKQFTATSQLCLMVIPRSGDLYYGTIKVYSCKVYDNETLIRDFVPCTNASGTAGLYDIVSGAFYTNAGSGTFTVGAASEGSATAVVGYAVSDDANAYPDGDFLDGYYYEKL